MKKIMIVDDEQISLMMTDYILSTEYRTVCASSGEEALTLYKKEMPDVVLSDLRMPGMSGYELLGKLQETYHETAPFMFMTADSDGEIESKGFETGALDFIRKPFRADVLLKRIGNILQTVEKVQGLQKAADTDPMTGLLNKASSQEEIGALCKSSQGVLMMIDLDSFKLVNDLYGHAMGDKVLIRFAEIIRSAVRSTDISGRLGGDEFIAFCQNVKDEDVIAGKAEYINEHLLASAKEFMGEDMNIPLGASIGCVFVPEEGTDFQVLYKKADKALYHVKQNGKHGYNIYHKAAPPEETKTGAGSDLANAVKIFSERSQTKGAYTLTNEQFRTVFRFLSRIMANYHKEFWMLLFSLSAVQDGSSKISFDEAAEEFYAVLRESLRQSDVLTQTGKNQFMALLLKMTHANLSVITNRVLANWAKTPYAKDYAVTFEADSMM